jgi:CRP-like cAMP-binding protein
MPQFEVFFNYVEDLSGKILSPEDKAVLTTHLKPKKLRKRQYFLQEGNVCKYAGFIVRGSARTFTVDEEGRERIFKLSVENWWLTDFESYYKLTPSRFNIEALEEMELLLITNAEVEAYFMSIPAFSAMMEVIKQNNAIANQTRMQAAISYTAEERYAELVRDYPHFLQRFPQNMIASYLGIAPETLSRIRSNALK